MSPNPRLKTLSVFRQPAFTMGLPRGLFVGLSLLCVIWTFGLAWWLGPLIFLIAYPPLYRAHERDPGAFAVWARALTSSPDAVRVDPVYLVVIWE